MVINPFTLKIDLDRISLNNIEQTSDNNEDKYQLGAY